MVGATNLKSDEVDQEVELTSTIHCCYSLPIIVSNLMVILKCLLPYNNCQSYCTQKNIGTLNDVIPKSDIGVTICQFVTMVYITIKKFRYK